MLPLLKLSEKLSLYPRKIHNFSLSKNTLIQKIPSLKNSKSIYLLYQNYLSKNIVTLNMQSMTSFSKKFLLWKIRNRCIFFSKIVCQRTSLLWICDRWPAFPKTFFSEEFEIYIYISSFSKLFVKEYCFEYDTLFWIRSMTSSSKKFLLWRIRNRYIFLIKIVKEYRFTRSISSSKKFLFKRIRNRYIFLIKIVCQRTSFYVTLNIRSITSSFQKISSLKNSKYLPYQNYQEISFHVILNTIDDQLVPKNFFSKEFEIYIYLFFQTCLSKNIVSRYFEYDRWPALPKNFFSEQFEIDISSLSKLSRNTVSHDR